MVRSAPPEKASLPEAITQPLMAASLATASTIAASSPITSGVITFMERPGMSQVASAMPSESVSKRKLVRLVIAGSGCGTIGSSIAFCRPRRVPQVRGKGIQEAWSRPLDRLHSLRSPGMTGRAVVPSNALDDGRRPHAGRDAERDEGGALARPLQLVEGGTEDHRAGRAEGMAHGDGAAAGVYLGQIEVERLHVAQHNGG